MWPSKTYTFSPSTTIASAKINQNFDDLLSAINTAMPSGGIIIWSGSIASIPSGWYLCDGNNSTPDLRGRFILGAGGSYTKGSTGGEETHALSVGEMPSHTHSVQQSINSDGANPGEGSHTYRTYTGGGLSLSYAGGNQAHNNMPPYFALAYIMKS